MYLTGEQGDPWVSGTELREDRPRTRVEPNDQMRAYFGRAVYLGRLTT